MGDRTTYTAAIRGPLTDAHLRLMSQTLTDEFGQRDDLVTENEDDGTRTHTFTWHDHSCGEITRLLGLLRAMSDPTEGITTDCPVCEGTGTDDRDDLEHPRPCTTCDQMGETQTILPPFAAWLVEDATSDWLGDVRIHVPDHSLFAGECDPQGTIVVGANDLTKIVNDATDLDTLKTQIAEATGEPAIAAFLAYNPPAAGDTSA